MESKMKIYKFTIQPDKWTDLVMCPNVSSLNTSNNICSGFVRKDRIKSAYKEISSFLACKGLKVNKFKLFQVNY